MRTTVLLLSAMILVSALPLAAGEDDATAAPPGFVERPDSLSPSAKQVKDVGPVPADMLFKIAIGLHLRDRAGLDAFLARTSDPTSSDDRRFLTEDEFNSRYGPTSAQEQRVIEWLTDSGFNVTGTSSSRLLVIAVGDSEAIWNAFHVTMRLVKDIVNDDGREKFATHEAPWFPADIAAFTTGVMGLDNLNEMRPGASTHSRHVLATGTAPSEATGTVEVTLTRKARSWLDAP